MRTNMGESPTNEFIVIYLLGATDATTVSVYPDTHRPKRWVRIMTDMHNQKFTIDDSINMDAIGDRLQGIAGVFKAATKRRRKQIKRNSRKRDEKALRKARSRILAQQKMIDAYREKDANTGDVLDEWRRTIDQMRAEIKMRDTRLVRSRNECRVLTGEMADVRAELRELKAAVKLIRGVT